MVYIILKKTNTREDEIYQMSLWRHNQLRTLIKK